MELAVVVKPAVAVKPSWSVLGRCPADEATVAAAARLYPSSMAGAQRLIARRAVACLRAAGHATATAGAYGEHATAETDVGGLRLVLVPMGAADGLDAALAIEDGVDPAVWHVHARGPDGALLAAAVPRYGCPSLLWAVRAGVDPHAAVGVALGFFGRGLA